MHTTDPVARILAAVSVLLLLGSCGTRPADSRKAATGSPLASCPQPLGDAAGLTDAQRDQLYQKHSAEVWKCYLAWVATIDPATLPYQTLSHTGMNAFFGPPEADSLAQAKAKADVIVSGTVISLLPKTNGYGTDVTITVAQVLKGQAGKTLKVLQASYLAPEDNYHGVVIVDTYSAPLLLPGETAFLFLKSFPQGLIQQTVTGTYYVRDGKIQTLELNPFKSTVNGKLPADFIAALAAA